jgi:two-component system NtrC family sensor kinase
LKQLSETGAVENNEMHAIIEKNILDCRRTIDSLLDFSGRKQYELETASLNEIIESALARYTKESSPSESVEVVKGFDPQLPQVIADAQQLEQAFYYLIRNAYSAMPTTGTLRIITRAVGSRVQVIVSDTGPGLSPADVRHIFDPFYTTSHNKNGLDLSITQAVMQRHNGAIEVESQPDRGTTFTIQLPKAAK